MSAPSALLLACLLATPAFQRQMPAAADETIEPCQPSPGTSGTYFVPGGKACSVTRIDFPRTETPYAFYPQPLYIIRVEGVHPGVLLSVRLTSNTPLEWSAVQGPAPRVSVIGSDVPAARQALFTWSLPVGVLEIRRQDVDLEPRPVAVTVERVPMARAVEDDLAAGHAQRLTVRRAAYDLLAEYGRCVRGDPRDDKCLEALLTDPKQPADARLRPTNAPAIETFQWPKQFDFSSPKDRVTAHLYYLVSRWIGRDPAYEFARESPKEYSATAGVPPAVGPLARAAIDIERGGPQRGSQSDPIILFIGVAGVNRVVLLDCQHLADAPVPSTDLAPRMPNIAISRTLVAGMRRCRDFAGPQARALERAESFWAVSVEDEDAPFDTTIEVEFNSPRPDPLYEEFDPRSTTYSPSTPGNGDAGQPIRVVWRQFRLRDRPTNVEIAFNRQGPGYGLRQWRSVFDQRSKLWIVPAAGVFVPSFPAEWTDTRLTRVYSNAGLELTGFEIVDRRVRRGIFATLSIQWPQLRGKADDADLRDRILIGLIPDAAFGIADERLFFTGASWPLPLWRDQTFVTAGATWAREERLPPSYTPGVRLSVSDASPLTPSTRLDPGFRVGLTIVLLKLRR